MTDTIDVDEIEGGYVASADPDVAWVELDGQVVIFEPRRSTSCVLNATAGLIWKLLDGTDTIDTLAADLADAFGVDVGTVRDDVLAAVRSFGSQGLLAGVRPAGAAEATRSTERFLLGPESP